MKKTILSQKSDTTSPRAGLRSWPAMIVRWKLKSAGISSIAVTITFFGATSTVACVKTTASPMLALVPVLADASHAAARKEAYPRGAGPLFVNVESFAQHVLGQSNRSNRAAIASALNRPFVPSGRSEVISWTDCCKVVEDGVYLEIDSMPRTPTGYRAYVTGLVTMNRGLGSAGPWEACPVQWSFDVVRLGDTWEVSRKQLLVTC